MNARVNSTTAWPCCNSLQSVKYRRTLDRRLPGKPPVRLGMDGNGTISTSSGSVEDIIYARDAANNYITRKLGSGTAEIVADNITAFTFAYYDANGSAVTSSGNSGNIRKVTINITARTAKPDPSYTSNSGYRTYQISADITPPNMAL